MRRLQKRLRLVEIEFITCVSKRDTPFHPLNDIRWTINNLRRLIHTRKTYGNILYARMCNGGILERDTYLPALDFFVF